MKNNKLTVIRGGLAETAIKSSKIFESAYITDTRLMGVLSMYVHWKLPDNPTMKDLHQFFYFDAEEYGFESYKSVLGNNIDEIEAIEYALIGGLGGQKININEREARYLLQEYVSYNKTADIPLPDEIKEYDFMLEPKIKLSQPEEYILMSKECKKIQSEYELVNYFMMRCIGRDFVAAKFLINNSFNLDLYPEFGPATLCKNTLDPAPQENALISESLIDYNDTYYIVISHITFNGLSIEKYERVSTFKITPQEASMMLSRPEYISVYEFIGDTEDFDSQTNKHTEKAMITVHDSGKLFMIFHQNNQHVDQRIYRLNEDVYGVYFISDYGQLLVAAYSLEEINVLEKELRYSKVAPYLIPSSKYEFKEPVLYEFVNSGMEDFEDFVELISDDF